MKDSAKGHEACEVKDLWGTAELYASLAIRHEGVSTVDACVHHFRNVVLTPISSESSRDELSKLGMC